MIIVAMRDRAWVDPLTDHRMWSQLTRAFGVSLVMVNGPEGVVEAVPPDHEIVLLDEEGVHEHVSFRWPERTALVVGRTSTRLIHQIPGYTSVRIGTPHRVSLFGIQAASIILAGARWPSTSRQT